jgi:NADH-quinone oxidoreductase subunit A
MQGSSEPGILPGEMAPPDPGNPGPQIRCPAIVTACASTGPGDAADAAVYFDFANLLVFLLLAAAFVVATLVAGRLLFRPRSTEEGAKLETYECGEPTMGPAWLRFDIRFYTIALMFVVFDVEVALLFPWGAVFRELVEEAARTQSGFGWVAVAEVLAFIVILMVGLAYVWARGDLEWTPRAGEVAGGERPAGREESA